MADHSWQGRARTLPFQTAAPGVEIGILQAIVYADLFDYPLTAAEVHRYLVGVAAPAAVVNAGLAALVASGRLLRRGKHYALHGRGSLVDVRRRRARTAARLWPEGIRYGRVLARLPFVRMVAITGSLAVDNVDAAGDIDYLIVTVPGRVWFGRGMAGLLRRVTRSGGVRLCANYLLSEQSLVIQDRNLYTAHELAQMVPVAGHAVYRRMLDLNPWTRAFLPNFPGEPPRRIADSVEKGWIGGLAEVAFGTPLGGWLDRLERARMVRKMVPIAESLREVTYSGECCKDHRHPHGQRILEAFAERLTLAGAAHE